MSDEDSLKNQARAWEKVFDLCRELGMELDFNRSGLDSVLDFIRARHAAGVAAEQARWLAAVETEQMETREGSPADYALDQLLRKMRR